MLNYIANSFGVEWMNFCFIKWIPSRLVVFVACVNISESNKECSFWCLRVVSYDEKFKARIDFLKNPAVTIWRSRPKARLSIFIKIAPGQLTTSADSNVSRFQLFAECRFVELFICNTTYPTLNFLMSTVWFSFISVPIPPVSRSYVSVYLYSCPRMCHWTEFISKVPRLFFGWIASFVCVCLSGSQASTCLYCSSTFRLQ